MGAELGFSTEHSLVAMVSIPGTRLGTAPEAEQRLGNAPGFGEQDGTAGRGDVTSTRILSTSRRALRPGARSSAGVICSPACRTGPAVWSEGCVSLWYLLLCLKALSALMPWPRVALCSEVWLFWSQEEICGAACPCLTSNCTSGKEKGAAY